MTLDDLNDVLIAGLKQATAEAAPDPRLASIGLERGDRMRVAMRLLMREQLSWLIGIGAAAGPAVPG